MQQNNLHACAAAGQGRGFSTQVGVTMALQREGPEDRQLPLQHPCEKEKKLTSSFAKEMRSAISAFIFLQLFQALGNAADGVAVGLPNHFGQAPLFPSPGRANAPTCFP